MGSRLVGRCLLLSLQLYVRGLFFFFVIEVVVEESDTVVLQTPPEPVQSAKKRKSTTTTKKTKKARVIEDPVEEEEEERNIAIAIEKPRDGAIDFKEMNSSQFEAAVKTAAAALEDTVDTTMVERPRRMELHRTRKIMMITWW